MVTLWALWHARRKAVYEDTFQIPLSTHNFVERFIADLDLSQPQPAARQITETRIPRWIPPPSGMSKLNVDAAVSLKIQGWQVTQRWRRKIPRGIGSGYARYL